MVSNIHDTTFVIKHIQDIFSLFFFSVLFFFFLFFYRFKTQACHFSARLSSNLTCSLYVRFRLVPCGRSPSSASWNTFLFSFNFPPTPSDGSSSIVIELLWRGSRCAAQGRQGAGEGQPPRRLPATTETFWSLHSAVMVRASPLHLAALNADGNDVRSRIKKVQKNVFPSSRRGKERLER